MELTGEIEELLKTSGLDFSRSNQGDIGIIASDRLNILAVPLNETSAEEAIRKNLVIRDIAAKMKMHPAIIAEDRWRSGKETISARILAHNGIFDSVFARNCEVRRINKEEGRIFLDKCHSYGDASCKYRYGLFVSRLNGKTASRLREGTMVGAAEFSKARRWEKGGKMISSYEWVRYASLPQTRIVGGMGKILKAFIDDVRPDDIMTYADLEWSEGNSYGELGFRKEGIREALTFRIDPRTWERCPAKAGEEEKGYLYYRNFGSAKYRLAFTEY